MHRVAIHTISAISSSVTKCIGARARRKTGGPAGGGCSPGNFHYLDDVTAWLKEHQAGWFYNANRRTLFRPQTPPSQKTNQIID